jgi:hypothetical protein
VVDNALVTDIDVQDLRGLPKPPETLRLVVYGRVVVLAGSDAQEFFHLQAIVEVYVTTELTQQELGCYHFHLGEVHHEGIATGVYLVGHRHESGGSVLRFQAESYDEIYQVLPDLLAPFRMAQAIDWKQTLQAIPPEERGEAITALATVEPKPPMVEWRLAERMAQIFKGYQNARVTQLSEWGESQRIRIDIIENPDEVQRLSKKILPEPWDEYKRIHIETGGGSATIQLTEEDYGVSSSHQLFYGGHFQGCSFGEHNSLTNYFGVIDKLGTVEEDIKQKLKEAREAIENSDLPLAVRPNLEVNLRLR